MKISFYSLAYDQLRALLLEKGLTSRTTDLLFNWHYKKKKNEICQLHGLSQKARIFLKENMDYCLPEIETIQLSKDKTVKFLMKMQDSSRVETVLIPFQNKYTVCLSSQVGCQMNCSFCFTGKQGLTRHLRTEEIVGQFMMAQNWLQNHRPQENRILNIVFMGQGEPLHNFEAVRDACSIFISQHGLSLADHKITVSTSGYLPGLLRWQNEMPAVNIAISLHSAIPEKRSQLIPLNRKYPLHEVVEWAEKIPQGKKRFVTYEYLLIRGFNDQERDAQALMTLLQGKKALLNLIPFNPFPGSPYERPTIDEVMKFKSYFEATQIPTMVRTTKGDEILAACGQLNTKPQGLTQL